MSESSIHPVGSIFAAIVVEFVLPFVSKSLEGALDPNCVDDLIEQEEKEKDVSMPRISSPHSSAQETLRKRFHGEEASAIFLSSILSSFCVGFSLNLCSLWIPDTIPLAFCDNFGFPKVPDHIRKRPSSDFGHSTRLVVLEFNVINDVVV